MPIHLLNTDDIDALPIFNDSNTEILYGEDEELAGEPLDDTFRFKFLCVECKTIDDVLKQLDRAKQYFQDKKNEGYVIGGGIEDDYMQLIKKEGMR